jgi:ABC-type spermidine/putrescine transport system permease subunit II
MTDYMLLLGSGIVLTIIFVTLAIRAYLRKVAKADEAREDSGQSKWELLFTVLLALFAIAVVAAVVW